MKQQISSVRKTDLHDFDIKALRDLDCLHTAEKAQWCDLVSKKTVLKCEMTFRFRHCFVKEVTSFKGLYTMDYPLLYQAAQTVHAEASCQKDPDSIAYRGHGSNSRAAQNQPR